MALCSSKSSNPTAFFNPQWPRRHPPPLLLPFTRRQHAQPNLSAKHYSTRRYMIAPFQPLSTYPRFFYYSFLLLCQIPRPFSHHQTPTHHPPRKPGWQHGGKQTTITNTPTSHTQKSQWDYTFSNFLIRSALGFSFGVVFSVLLFKRRAWPAWLGLGFGAGRAYEEADGMIFLSPPSPLPLIRLTFLFPFGNVRRTC